MGFLQRFLRRISETDEERLSKEILEWASSVPDTVRIADAPSRSQVKVVGVVRRITVIPAQGTESLQAQITDGTGEVVLVWMGRRSIPGLSLGTRVVVQGVLAQQRSGRRMVNPRFEFTA